MNDDELNELLARHESETPIFREMDAKRERDALEAWRQAGNRGKVPLPLIQLEELPECYQTDEPFDVKDTEEVFEGRGQRPWFMVSYNDGLDDDTCYGASRYICGLTRFLLSRYIQVLEDGEDIQELADRAREKKDRRAHQRC
jgi:ATP-dependent helicase STH1/SNF2